MQLDEIVKAWNAQADGYNQWQELDADERVEFALQYVEDFQRDKIAELKRQLVQAKDLIKRCMTVNA